MQLDFGDRGAVVSFLKRDKHKLLEGMCVEHMFRGDVVSAKGWNNLFSDGWWAVPNPQNSRQYLLFHVSKDPVTASDTNVYSYLENLGIPVVHVRLHNNVLWFYEASVLRQHGWQWHEHLWMPENVFRQKYSLNSFHGVHMATADTRNEFLQDRAVSFFENAGILHDIGLQRYFANYFLTGYVHSFTVNLDGFILMQDGLRVVEIKYKFPDQQGNYGINKGQARLFEWFIGQGVLVEHYIIRNPIDNKHLAFLDALTNIAISTQLQWQSHQLTIQELTGQYRSAPQETAIGGNTEVKYVSIPSGVFQPLQQVTVGTGINTQSILKRVCPDCGQNLVLRQGPYGYFWGCSSGYRVCKFSKSLKDIDNTP